LQGLIQSAWSPVKAPSAICDLIEGNCVLKSAKKYVLFGGVLDIANKAKSNAIGANIHIRSCADDLAPGSFRLTNKEL